MSKAQPAAAFTIGIGNATATTAAALPKVDSVTDYSHRRSRSSRC